jgi:hypothetical protein
MPVTTDVINIGPKETRKRLVLGVVLFSVSVTLAVIFSHAGLGSGWYAALFLPFWAGTLAFYQARKKT